MKWFYLTIGLLLLLGPLRRPFFRNWRFTVPAMAGAVLGWVVTSSGMRPSDPPWMPVIVSLVVGLGAGAGGKQWLDEVFGKEK
jgi:hypothetical protein